MWISIHRDNWFGVWVGLELNLLCFIPFLTQRREVYREARVKYFLVQSCASLLLLIRRVRMVNYFSWFRVFIRCALLLKLGVAPFYFWYLRVGSGVKWLQFLGLSTIQKITPLVLLFFREVRFKIGRWLILLRVGMSGFAGGVGGINELSLRKLLVYSSINHLGWILIPLSVSNEFWLVYFIVYCLLVGLLVVVFLIFGFYHVNQLFSVKISLIRKSGLALGLLSLGGLPPLLGFFPKLIIIEVSRGVLINLIIYIIIASRVIALYYYIRIGVGVLILNFNSAKILRSKVETISSRILISISISGTVIYYFAFQRFLQ